MLSGVAHEDDRRFDDREMLRLLLFPRLSPEEGRRRIDEAFEGAADDERAQRIEELAQDPDLVEEVFRRLSHHRGNGLS
jgi:hypothetical protein